MESNNNETWVRWLPSFLREKIQGRQSLQSIISNTGWLFADKILRMGCGLLVGVWVARYLGPAQFGLLSYAGAFVALFTAIANLGLDSIVVRDIVRHPEAEQEILGSAFVLKLAGGILALIFATGFISLLRTDHTTRLLVAIVALGMIFQAFDTIDFYFQSKVLARYAVWAKNAAFAASSLAKVFMIATQSPLVLFAWAGAFETAIAAIGLVATYRAKGHSMKAWRPQFHRARILLQDSWPLILSGLAVMVYVKIDMVMLGNMVGDEAVGLYSVATRISECWYFIPMSIVSSVYPSIVKTKAADESFYLRRVQRLFSGVTMISVVVALGMTLLSPVLVGILFGSKFLAAAPVLAIHIWALVFVGLGVAQGPWDLSENLTKLALFRTVIGAIMNIGLNLYLIPAYSAVGAAIATVISYAFSGYILNVMHPRTRGVFLAQTKSFLFVR